jgi:hypothetical protein
MTTTVSGSLNISEGDKLYTVHAVRRCDRVDRGFDVAFRFEWSCRILFISLHIPSPCPWRATSRFFPHLDQIVLY